MKCHNYTTNYENMGIRFSNVYDAHLRGLLWAMLQDGMKHLHVVRISGIGQLVKDHKFNHGAQVISVCIQELSATQLNKHQKKINKNRQPNT